MLMDTKSDAIYTLNVNIINLVNSFTVEGSIKESMYHITKNRTSYSCYCSLRTAFIVDGEAEEAGMSF